MAGSGDMALQAGVAAAVELIMAHPVAMETGSPVAHVRLQEWFIVLGYGKIRGVRGLWVIRDVDIGRKRGALHSQVIQEGVNLGNCSSCCTRFTPHGILFPFSLRTTLCHFSPDHVHRTVQARLCHKRCRHVIGLDPYRLSMTSYPLP